MESIACAAAANSSPKLLHPAPTTSRLELDGKKKGIAKLCCRHQSRGAKPYRAVNEKQMQRHLPPAAAIQPGSLVFCPKSNPWGASWAAPVHLPSVSPGRPVWFGDNENNKGNDHA